MLGIFSKSLTHSLHVKLSESYSICNGMDACVVVQFGRNTVQCTYSYCKITNTVYATDNIVFETFEAVYSIIPAEIDMLLWFVSALTSYNVYVQITGYVCIIILYTVHCTVCKEKCPVFLRIGRARPGFKAKNRCAVYTLVQVTQMGRYTVRQFNMLLLCSIWRNCPPFPSVWLNFTSHIELCNSIVSHTLQNAPKLFEQCR